MEEVARTSRKRKHQTSNNPLVGIFTRGKTRKYLHHCSRSGKVRPDPVRTRNPVPEVPANQRPACVGVDDDDEIYNVPIKDLRARRVFSKAPPGGDCKDGIGKSGNSDLVSGNVVCDLDESGGKLEGLGKLGKEVDLLVLRKCDSGVGLNGGNPNLLDECDLRVDFRDGGSDGRNPNLLEKCELGVDGRDPNLLGKCEPGVDGRNPNTLDKCGSGVDFGDGGSGGRNPNLLAKCDSGFHFRSNGDSNGGKTNSPLGLIGVSGAKGDGAGVLSDVGERLGSEKPEKFDVGLACNVPVLDDMSPEVTTKDSKVPEDALTTPPDAVILIRQTDDLSVRQNRKAASSSPPKHFSPSKDGCVEAKKTFSNSKRNSVLRPCSRQKVFRAPNSFSYRRLLPYLMDIAKDTSSGLKLNPCSKLENDVEEKLTVSSSQENIIDVSNSDEKQVPTVFDCTIQEVSIDSEEEKKISLDSKSTDSTAELAVVETLVDSATDNSRANLVNRNEILAIMSIHSPKVLPKDKQVSSDNLGKLEHASQVAKPDLAALSDSPKDASPKSPLHLSLGTEGELKAEIAVVETEENPTSVCHRPSKLEAVVSSAALVRAEAKGILKRNPRGCRGVCNCLNCSSFRLNAEKAFEFSRNQFLDAEELALDLMKELSNLRSMLEKSADGANSHAIVPVDELQKACRKAFDLENTARNRLTQMNEDLQVHCRTKPLQRPKVNFSDDFKEEINKNQPRKVTKKPRLAYRTVSTRSSSSLE